MDFDNIPNGIASFSSMNLRASPISSRDNFSSNKPSSSRAQFRENTAPINIYETHSAKFSNPGKQRVSPSSAIPPPMASYSSNTLLSSVETLNGNNYGISSTKRNRKLTGNNNPMSSIIIHNNPIPSNNSEDNRVVTHVARSSSSDDNVTQYDEKYSDRSASTAPTTSTTPLLKHYLNRNITEKHRDSHQIDDLGTIFDPRIQSSVPLKSAPSSQKLSMAPLTSSSSSLNETVDKLQRPESRKLYLGSISGPVLTEPASVPRPTSFRIPQSTSSRSIETSQSQELVSQPTDDYFIESEDVDQSFYDQSSNQDFEVEGSSPGYLHNSAWMYSDEDTADFSYRPPSRQKSAFPVHLADEPSPTSNRRQPQQQQHDGLKRGIASDKAVNELNSSPRAGLMGRRLTSISNDKLKYSNSSNEDFSAHSASITSKPSMEVTELTDSFDDAPRPPSRQRIGAQDLFENNQGWRSDKAVRISSDFDSKVSSYHPSTAPAGFQQSKHRSINHDPVADGFSQVDSNFEPFKIQVTNNSAPAYQTKGSTKLGTSSSIDSSSGRLVAEITSTSIPVKRTIQHPQISSYPQPNSILTNQSPKNSKLCISPINSVVDNHRPVTVAIQSNRSRNPSNLPSYLQRDSNDRVAQPMWEDDNELIVLPTNSAISTYLPASRYVNNWERDWTDSTDDSGLVQDRLMSAAGTGRRPMPQPLSLPRDDDEDDDDFLSENSDEEYESAEQIPCLESSLGQEFLSLFAPH